MEDDCVLYWTFFHRGLANHKDLTLDFQLNEEFNNAFTDLSYIASPPKELFLKDKYDGKHINLKTIENHRKTQ